MVALKIAMFVTALALIGVGGWMVSPPLGFLAVGLVLWIDMAIMGLARRNERTTRHIRNQ